MLFGKGLNVTQTLACNFEMVNKVVENGGNAASTSIFFFSAMYSNAFLVWVIETCDYAVKGLTSLKETIEKACNKHFLLCPQLYLHVLFERQITSLNPFPNKPLFLPVCNTSLLKTIWEKEKLVITSNFCFFQSIFNLFLKKEKILVSSIFSFSLNVFKSLLP